MQAEGWQELKIQAERGATEAQFNWGVMYEKGEGRPQDYVEAVKWVVFQFGICSFSDRTAEFNAVHI